MNAEILDAVALHYDEAGPYYLVTIRSAPDTLHERAFEDFREAIEAAAADLRDPCAYAYVEGVR